MRQMFRLADGLSFILASASPRRQNFFSDLGIKFEAMPVDNEPTPLKDESGYSYVERATATKLKQCRKQLASVQNCVILAADTCVELNGRIFCKPSDSLEAYRMLTELNGEFCQVLSAARMRLPKGEPSEIAITESIRVKFNRWPDEIIKAYIKTEEPLDKAGAFAIQGVGSFLIDFIDGSYTTVMGLPGSWIIEKMLGYKIIYPCC